MADSALRLISKTGREALDIENDMVRILGLVDWVRAIASEPNMHPIRRRFNLNAVGSYLARRKQRKQPAYWQPRKTALACTSDGGRAGRRNVARLLRWRRIM